MVGGSESNSENVSIDSYVAAEAKRQEAPVKKYFSMTILLVFFGVGVFIVGSNITGNVVRESSLSGNSLIGIIFLLIGALGLFLRFRK